MDPHNVWNTDKTGFTTVHKLPKIVVIKGEKQVVIVTSPEQGELVTVCDTVNTAGNHIPPYMVFPRVNWQDRMIHGVPPGIIGVPVTGWINTTNFVKFLQRSIKIVKCNKNSKVLIKLDNHDSRINIESLNYDKD